MRRLARLAMYVGTVAAVVGLSKVHAAWIADPAYDYTGSGRFAWSFAYTALLCLAAYGVGLPDLVADRRSAVMASLGATAGGAVAISAVQLVVGSALLPRFVVFGSAGVLVAWYVVCALASSGGRSRAEERDRVVVVAEHDEVETLRDDLRLAPERNAQIVAALGAAAAVTDNRSKPLVDAVVANRATVVVLSRAAQADETIVLQAASLHEAGVRVRTLSLFYEEWLAKLPVSELERVSLMFDIGEIHRARYGRLKRLTDLSIGIAALPVLALAIPFVFFGDLVANGGTLFYRQERVGRNAGVFEILKFRTMRAGDPTSEWTSAADPRITPFGQLLRRTHIDELPQVINILRGDLSVVGPRPEQPRYVDELRAKIPFYDLRHLVRPGLTGWAQVKYGYAGTETDALQKLQYEFFYLRRQSLTFDVRIIGRTIRSVIGMGGR